MHNYNKNYKNYYNYIYYIITNEEGCKSSCSLLAIFEAN